MIIKQTRIISLKHFDFLEDNSKIRLGLSNLKRFGDKLLQLGFSNNSFSGTKILPSVFNSLSLKNAEVYTTIDRSTKEMYTQTRYWTRLQWAGRGKTQEKSGFVYIDKERYKRLYHQPFSVEFTILQENDVMNLYSDELILNVQNTDRIINTVNLLLSVFGECEIFCDNISIRSKIVRLAWDIFPPGKFPWEKLSNEIAKITKYRNNTTKKLFERNCKCISNLGPDFTAVGSAGFYGYIIFGFPTKNLFVLESIHPNNATYIFENDWESLSKLSKAEILNENLHKKRIIHTKNWEEQFNNYFINC